MQSIKWQYYPRVAAHPTARAFVESQARLQKSPKTVDAYARNLEDFMQAFDGGQPDRFIDASLDDIEHYVDALSTRQPRTAGNKAKITRITKTKLSPATIQQRIVTARLFFDFCILRGLRKDKQNPVLRGRRGCGSERPRRGAFVRHQRLAWIPPDDEWERIVTHVLQRESIRDQVLVLLAYEGALRRQELLGLRRDDIDLGAGLITIRSECSKTGIQRTVTFSAVTGMLLTRYLRQDRALLLATFGGEEEGPLFLSESHRNPGTPLAIGAFNDVISRIRRTLNMPQLTPHTLRHLRLTVLQRSNVDLQDIALYAGHASIATTQIYLHMAPAHLARRISAALAPYDLRLRRLMEAASGK
jgi:site-specific recombinase XerD